MLDKLREQLAVAHLLAFQRQRRAVLRLRLVHNPTQVAHLQDVVHGPDDAAVAIHGSHGTLVAKLQHHGALVVPNRHLVALRRHRQRPHALHAVVQRRLQAVSARTHASTPVSGQHTHIHLAVRPVLHQAQHPAHRDTQTNSAHSTPPPTRQGPRPQHVRSAVPDANRAVLSAGQDDGQLRVEARGDDVVGVAWHRRDAALRLVVPNLDGVVVRTRDEVRLVTTGVVVDAVHAAVVTLQREVGHVGGEAPYLHRAVQRRGGEGVGVLGVELHHHHVVGVALEYPGALPVAVPVPHPDLQVVGHCQYQRQRRVDGDAADVVRVARQRRHAVRGVVVVHPQHHLVTARDNPLLPRHELGRPHWLLADLDGLHLLLRLVVPYEHVAAVQRGQHPWLRRVEVHALHALATLRKLLLQNGTRTQTHTRVNTHTHGRGAINTCETLAARARFALQMRAGNEP